MCEREENLAAAKILICALVIYIDYFCVIIPITKVSDFSKNDVQFSQIYFLSNSQYASAGSTVLNLLIN